MIKGWKHAGSDLMKHRAEQRNASRTVKLVRVNKNGTESGMHDATKHFDTEEEAHSHHKRMRSLNPNNNIRHNLYVNGEHKGLLADTEGSQHTEQPANYLEHLKQGGLPHEYKGPTSDQ